MVSWQEQYITGERSERVRYCSCHKNIKFISSRLRAISSVSYSHVIDIIKAWKELYRHFFSVSLKNDSRILIFFFLYFLSFQGFGYTAFITFIVDIVLIYQLYRQQRMQEFPPQQFAGQPVIQQPAIVIMPQNMGEGRQQHVFQPIAHPGQTVVIGAPPPSYSTQSQYDPTQK